MAPVAGPFATSLALTRSAGTVGYGTTLTLTGSLLRADGTPVADAAVQVLSRTAGQYSVVVLSTLRTASDGRIATGFAPRTSAEYQLRYGGDSFNAPALSNKTVAYVQPHVTGAFSPAGLKLGQASVVPL